MDNHESKSASLDKLQKTALSLMAVLALLTFIGANLQALLWQSSEWLVSTVLPAVVVQLTNEERADNSAVPLQRNTTLDQAAKLKAEHMAKNEYFSHFSPDGVSPWYWFDQAGYVYAHAGENLAIHFTDSSEVVDAWMDSPTHRQNIVNGIYTEIGVGTAKGKFDGYDTVYVVQLFGTPAIHPVPVDKPEPLAVADAVLVSESEPVISQTEPVKAEIVEVEEVLLAQEDVVEVSEPVIPESPEPVKTTESLLFDADLEVSAVADNVVVRSPVIATSSGLAVASVDTNISAPHAGGTLASIATQPNAVLQFIYTILALAVVMMLGTSIVMEAKRFNYQQVAYGFFLLFGMGGLWFMHSILTTGAVIT